MVRLTRIYTKTGDAGQTHLGDMSRVEKTDPRLIAYADVDETNSVIGVALALAPPEPEVAAARVTAKGILAQLKLAVWDPLAEFFTRAGWAPIRSAAPC